MVIFYRQCISQFYNLTATGRPMIELANDCHFDVMIPGNHDLEWELNILKISPLNYKQTMFMPISRTLMVICYFSRILLNKKELLKLALLG